MLTSIVRDPIPGPLHLGMDGVAGNRTAVRTKQVLEGAAASQRMHCHLQAGDVVWVRPPAGQFILDRSGFRRVALISVGVSPMPAMLKAHLGRGPEAPSLIRLHAIRNARTQAFREESAALLAADVLSRRRRWAYVKADQR